MLPRDLFDFYDLKVNIVTLFAVYLSLQIHDKKTIINQNLTIQTLLEQWNGSARNVATLA